MPPALNMLAVYVIMFGLKCITPAAGFVLFCLSKKEPKKDTRHRIQPDGGKQLCGSFVHSGKELWFPDVVPG